MASEVSCGVSLRVSPRHPHRLGSGCWVSDQEPRKVASCGLVRRRQDGTPRALRTLDANADQVKESLSPPIPFSLTLLVKSLKEALRVRAVT